jgi:hypothetical protein
MLMKSRPSLAVSATALVLILLTALVVGIPSAAASWEKHGCTGAVKTSGATGGGQFGAGPYDSAGRMGGAYNGVFSTPILKMTRATKCAKKQLQIVLVRMDLWAWNPQLQRWESKWSRQLASVELPPGYYANRIASKALQALWLDVTVIYTFEWITAKGVVGTKILRHNEVRNYSCPSWCAVRPDPQVGAYMHFPGGLHPG